MNEQELADLFSEQLDRMLEGQTPQVGGDADELTQLFDLGNQLSQTQFQAGAVAQTAFQSLLAGWFGIHSGGTSMILGLTKTWFIGIIISVITVVTGVVVVGVLAVRLFIVRTGEPLPITPTVIAVVTETPTATATTSVTEAATTEPEATPTEVAATPTVSTEPTPDDDDDYDEDDGDLPPLVLVPVINLPTVCQGVYVSQQTLVNYSNLPVDNSSLVWEVIEGAEMIDSVGLDSPILVAANAETGDDQTAATTEVVPVSDQTVVNYIDYADFQPVAANQQVKLDVKVKVKDNWWNSSSETKIKVKVSIKNKLPYKNKLDFKLHYKSKGHGGHSQIITIV
jgi:hypothetical protein